MRGKAFAAVLQGADVHLLGRNLYPFLGQEYAHPPRVRRLAKVVELHRITLPIPLTPRPYPARGRPASMPSDAPADRPKRLLRFNPRPGKILSLVLRNFSDL